MGKVKSTVSKNTTTKKELEFPRLMKSNNSELIVFMTGKGEGIALQANRYHDVGFFSNAWNMDIFSDFDGEITLKNE